MKIFAQFFYKPKIRHLRGGYQISKKLLDMFGDDWYIDDGAWQCVEKNKNMEALRQKLKTKNEAAENYSKNKKNE